MRSRRGPARFRSPKASRRPQRRGFRSEPLAQRLAKNRKAMDELAALSLKPKAIQGDPEKRGRGKL